MKRSMTDFLRAHTVQRLIILPKKSGSITNFNQMKMQVATSLFEKGVLSSGQAAELVGISKREFLETAGNYGVSIFGETSEDIEKIMNG